MSGQARGTGGEAGARKRDGQRTYLLGSRGEAVQEETAERTVAGQDEAAVGGFAPGVSPR